MCIRDRAYNEGPEPRTKMPRRPLYPATPIVAAPAARGGASIMLKFAAKATVALAGLGLAAGLALSAAPAEARVFVHIGVPFYGPYYGYGGPYYNPYYYAPPVVYTAPPVVYAPPPVVYQALAPAPVAAPQAQTWYYCDNPKGYYPYVSSCSSGWRQVPARP